MALKELCDPQAVLFVPHLGMFAAAPPDAWTPNILLLLVVVLHKELAPQAREHHTQNSAFPGQVLELSEQPHLEWLCRILVVLAAEMLAMSQQKVEALNHTGLHGCFGVFFISTNKNGEGTGR